MIHKNWAELIKPTQLEVKPGNNPARQATVIAEPLERGFGLTLGNALRRILMSSLQGAAITAVQIDNVLHEFSSVSGVREDVTDIVLNLKQVVFTLSDAPAGWATIDVTGPGEVTASMIEGHPDLVVANPDHVICTLTEEGDFQARMYVDVGRGYVDRESHVVQDEVIGVIVLSKLGLDQFGPHDLRHLGIYASIAAQAMVNADIWSASQPPTNPSLFNWLKPRHG